MHARTRRRNAKESLLTKCSQLIVEKCGSYKSNPDSKITMDQVKCAEEMVTELKKNGCPIPNYRSLAKSVKGDAFLPANGAPQSSNAASSSTHSAVAAIPGAGLPRSSEVASVAGGSSSVSLASGQKDKATGAALLETASSLRLKTRLSADDEKNAILAKLAERKRQRAAAAVSGSSLISIGGAATAGSAVSGAVPAAASGAANQKDSKLSFLDVTSNPVLMERLGTKGQT